MVRQRTSQEFRTTFSLWSRKAYSYPANFGHSAPTLLGGLCAPACRRSLLCHAREDTTALDQPHRLHRRCDGNSTNLRAAVGSCITAPNLVRACTRCIWPRLRAGSPPRWGGGGDSALHRRGLGTPGCGCGHGEHDLVRGCPGVRSACRSFMDVPGHSPPPTTNIDARLLCAESDDPWTPTWLPYHPWRRVARCWFEPMGDASRPGVSHVFHTCDTAPGHDTHCLWKRARYVHL